MMRMSSFVLLIMVLCLSLGILQSENSFAKDPEITPEKVVAKHLKSLGTPENLAAIKSRLVMGTASYAAQSHTTKNGLFQIASEGRKLGIATNSYARAYDGRNATISSHPHPLRDFVRRYDGLLKEWLMGGTMSVAWPLLDVKERQPKLKYSKKKIDGQQLHELTYNPKSRSGTLQLRIKLFFDFETFRHAMTEYSYSHSGIMLLFREQFGDFREVDGLMLPHRYTIYYSSEKIHGSTLSFPQIPPTPTGPSSTFIGRWTMKAEQWQHNTQIDPQHFKAN